MTRLRLSAAARRDLADIRRYSIREFGVEIADAYTRGFKKSFGLLREQPFAGAVEPGLKQEVRAFTYRRHRIFYRIEGQVVEIVRVLHHARDAQAILNA